MIIRSAVRSFIRVLALMLLFLPMTQAQEFVWAPELPVGAALPPIHAQDQSGTERTLEELTGENGMVLVMSRSFDWCPYCISQLQRLVDVAEQFEAMGISVATMTYDPVAALAEAAEEYETTFPLLYDEDVKHVNAMGIRNMEYEPGHRAYGIPYPGIFLLDADGMIRAKFAEEDYRERPEFELVMEAAKKL